MNCIDEDSAATSKSELAQACSEQDYNRARELLATGSNPVTSRAGYFSWSPLHYTARHGHLDFTRMLISQYGCHPEVEDKEGRTPLHIACQYGQLKFATYLIEQKRCDASYLDVEDQTPLHHACGWLSECSEEKSLEVCRYLVSSAKCDPNARDVNGRSCVLHACEKGFVSVLKYFLTECRCSLTGFDYKGNNALHLAVSFSNQFDIVNYIIGENVVDIESRNNKGNNVLHMAAIANSSQDICKLILDHNRTGSLLQVSNEDESTPLDLANRDLHQLILSRFQVHKDNYYDKFAANLGVKRSPESHCRIFVVGDKESGKSTLIRSLMKESSSFSSSFSLSFSPHSPTSLITDESRGLNVAHFESKIYGHVAFYDFSGNDDYTSIHNCVLQCSFRPVRSLFIIVLNLGRQSHEINSSFRHWLAFLSSTWQTSSDPPPKVIVVGSHSDVVKSCGKSNRSGFKSLSFDNLESLFGKFEIVAKIQAEFHKSEYSGIAALRKQLGVCCSKSENENGQLSFNACCLLTYLNSRFISQHIITVKTLLSEIKLYDIGEEKISDVRYFLSDNVPILVRLLESLDRAGHVSFLLNKADMEQSLVIVQPHELFSDLTLLWNSERNASHLTDQQLIPLSSLAAMFPEEDINLIIQVFTCFKLCVPVDKSTQVDRSPAKQKKLFYFPSLLSDPPPKDLWGIKSSYGYNFGWITEVSNTEENFSQQLIHTALQHSMSASVSTVVVETISLWKNGLYLKCNANGIFEVILEASQDLKAVFLLMRAKHFNPMCLKYRSTVIGVVRTYLKEASSVECTESLMDPFDAMQYPLQPRDSLTLFGISDILHSIKSKRLVVKSKEEVEIKLNELLHFEPLAFIRSECLTVLRNGHLSQLISDEFLKSMADAVMQESSESSDKMLPIFSSIFVSEQTSKNDLDGLYSVFLSWKSHDSTYSDIVSLLEQFSLLKITDLNQH